MNRVVLVLLFVVAGLASCQSPSEAELLVRRSIEAHGLDRLRHGVLSFDFRDRHFELHRNGGRFRFTRTYEDSTGAYYEVLSNDSLYRLRDGEMVTLTERDARILHEAINSVQYLATLPLSLTDRAVQEEVFDTVDIGGEPYVKVNVSFTEEGGGRDWTDRYVFWFHRDRHTMDYFAYDYESGDGGTRFRQAINPRRIEGVLIQDYLNMTADPLIGHEIARYDEFIGTDSLKLVSRIMHENASVRLLR
ncbi:MAG TPA: DUF6503 family protein [Rhodothermales bacterium]